MSFYTTLPVADVNFTFCTIYYVTCGLKHQIREVLYLSLNVTSLAYQAMIGPFLSIDEDVSCEQW